MRTVVDIRRENLQRWIDERCSGVQANFIALTEINQGELSGLLKNKSFGEKKARSIEEKAGMPAMWLDTPNITNNQQNQNYGSGTQNNVIGVQNNNFLSNSSTLKKIIMPDNSFAPHIPQGSELSYNSNDTAITDGKIYLIQQGNMTFIRRIFRQLSGYLKLTCDNKDFDSSEIVPDNIQIVGRVVAWTVRD